MALPDLQTQRYADWQTQLSQITAEQHSLVAKLQTALTELQQPPTAEAAETVAEREQRCVLLYTQVLLYALALASAYELEAVRTIGVNIAREILQFLHGNLSIWKAMKAITMPGNRFAQTDWLTLTQNNIRFADLPVGMVFDLHNQLHFLTQPSPPSAAVLKARGPAAAQAAPARKIHKVLSRPTETEAATSADTTEASSAGMFEKLKSKIKPPPLKVIIKIENHPNATADVNELHRIKNQGDVLVAAQTTTGALQLTADIELASTNPNSRYFSHPTAHFIARLTGEKTVDFFVSGRPATDSKLITDTYTCAIRQIAFSPDPHLLLVLLVNGQMQLAQVNNERKFIQYQLTACNAQVVSRIAWLSETLFMTLSSEQTCIALYEISLETPEGVQYRGAPSATYDPYGLPNKNSQYCHFVPFKKTPTGTLVRQEILQLKKPEEAGGILIYKHRSLGNCIRLYNINHFEAVLEFKDSNGFPIGATLSEDNLFLAIRYSDGSIRVVDLEEVLHKKMSLEAATLYLDADGKLQTVKE